MANIICDFCSSPEVVWSFPSRDFSRVVEAGGFGVQANMSEAWAACQPCHDLIVKSDREALVERSVETYIELYGREIPRPVVAQLIRGLHDAFWANREGAPEPVKRGEA